MGWTLLYLNFLYCLLAEIDNELDRTGLFVVYSLSEVILSLIAAFYILSPANLTNTVIKSIQKCEKKM